MSSSLPKPKVIFVDVDDTLIFRNGSVNRELIKFLSVKRSEGFTLVLWSMAGEAHAREASAKAGMDHLFSNIISKPGYIVDDKRWHWIRDTKAFPVIPKK